MSPLLEQEQPKAGQEYKFVRDGNSIAYGPTDAEHKQIAIEHNVGEPLYKGQVVMVDDGGHLRRTSSEGYKVGGVTTSCEFKDDPLSARAETIRVIEETTSETAKHTSFTS